jgi:GST-like protein
MLDPAMFPITRKWPAAHPDRVPALFAEHAEWRQGLDHARGDRVPYEPHLVRFDAGEQKSPEFLALNPYGKIPAIIDPNGPGGKPLRCSSRARS